MMVPIVKTGIPLILALFIAVSCKYHYSNAGSDVLGWILGPTAGMVELISGIRFEKEAGAGFVNSGHGIIIAPSCAGVNFLIIVFCMSAFTGMPHLRSTVSKVVWLWQSAGLAYLLTITGNAVRIAVSIYSYRIGINYGWLTPERLHRIEGIIVYCLFLSLFYLGLTKVLGVKKRNGMRKNHHRNNSGSYRLIHIVFVPLFWYILISLGIPLLNRAYLENGPQFAEHAVITLSVSTVVLLLVFLIQYCCGWIWKGRSILK